MYTWTALFLCIGAAFGAQPCIKPQDNIVLRLYDLEVLLMSMISVSGLTFGYESSYDLVFENATFQLDTDWKLGFTGRNGRGKTTFLKLLMGEHPHGPDILQQIGRASCRERV